MLFSAFGKLIVLEKIPPVIGTVDFNPLKLIRLCFCFVEVQIEKNELQEMDVTNLRIIFQG